MLLISRRAEEKKRSGLVNGWVAVRDAMSAELLKMINEVITNYMKLLSVMLEDNR